MGREPTDIHRLVRMVRCTRGEISFEAEVAPRFDDGRATHTMEEESLELDWLAARLDQPGPLSANFAPRNGTPHAAHGCDVTPRRA